MNSDPSFGRKSSVGVGGPKWGADTAPAAGPEAESSTQAAMRAELHFIREERDRLRCELVDSRAKVANYRELQTELARARARIAALDR
ncbi:hypothetical protein CDL15_Pgr002602 [Punica granatum]|uniref:Uncharacterized protein n=1 Tax=Punica granatum TaxID=22663 RepID=A0A218WJ92_PUNGR|nr:hypothetical protein CDL15_Pgr002602 [Punica granatum]